MGLFVFSYGWKLCSDSIELSINDFLKRTNNSTSWQSISSILSPSDVGIHNSLIVQSSVVFFDFEYSGYDDLSKFALDWVLQPNFPFDCKLESLFIQLLREQFSCFGSSWLQRYSDSKKLAFYRWILIQLKSLPLRSDQRSFDKLVSYINCCNAIHGFALDVSSLESP